jgi:hypothetical protein
MSGNIGIHGIIHVVATDPETGDITYDSGLVKNTVTKAGVQMLLYSLAGGAANVDSITGGVTGITEADYVTRIAVGEADTGLDTAAERYDSVDVSAQMADEEVVNATDYKTTITMVSTYDHADGSYVRFKAKFTGFTTETLAWVALEAGSLGADPLAVNLITPFTPGAAQVDVTYTIYITQDTEA